VTGPDLHRLARRLRRQLGAQGCADLADLLVQAEPSAPAKTPRSRAGGHPDAIAAQLSPILARADEKAGLLIDALTKAGHRVEGIAPRGLKPTITRLVALCGQAAVQQAADQVIADAKAFGALRETVV
jgi:hypothetical protein